MLSRRAFLIGTGTAGALLALRNVFKVPMSALAAETSPFGSLRADPDKILDLPEGFSYQIISRTGDNMDDGLLVPGAHDGMAAFANDTERVTLICNHELNFSLRSLGPFGKDESRLGHISLDKIYDAGGRAISPGGTTTLIYNLKTKIVEKHFLSLIGTERNCAGGPTPWGSWLSCEESVSVPDGIHSKEHGWVFEVPATANGLVDPIPLKAMGRFNHEAVAVDPRTGIVYQTEDRKNGLIYRFIPDQPGQLQSGRLQALTLQGSRSADTRNWSANDYWKEGETFSAGWIDLKDIESPKDSLRKQGRALGAAIFARGEGMWSGQDEIYFACTSGGKIGAGQIFRYRPSPYEGTQREKESPGQLQLLVESTDPQLLNNCDNITVTPWGDVMVCEDAVTACSLVGVTASGDLYHFAENAYSDSELAGVCFSPDGSTLFVNIQEPGLTLAISGPFPASG